MHSAAHQEMTAGHYTAGQQYGLADLYPREVPVIRAQDHRIRLPVIRSSESHGSEVGDNFYPARFRPGDISFQHGSFAHPLIAQVPVAIPHGIKIIYQERIMSTQLVLRGKRGIEGGYRLLKFFLYRLVD